MITSIPVITNEGKFVVELLKDVTNTFLVEGIEIENISDTYEKINRLNDLLVKDELTGIFNRRFINERLDVEIFKAISYGQPASIIMADIDYFKKVNDTHGHLAGDEVLKEFAKIIQRNIRSEIDWAARYGGEEFLIFLSNTDGKGAYQVAERIRKELENNVIKYEGNKIKITASFGISTVSDTVIPAIELINLADQKLYEAKKSGRNKVVA